MRVEPKVRMAGAHMMRAKRTWVFWAAWTVLSAPSRSAWVGQAAVAAAEVQPSGEMVRALFDPGTGNCWVLKREEGLPGGPGRWVRTGSMGDACRAADRGADAAGARQARGSTSKGPPLIRAGERMVVEEKTAVLEVRLEAVALEPGWPGAEIGVRLAIGGKRVRAMVLGPGRARLLPGKGLWR